MAELPSGTVTFLFTDIEGSTRLLGRLRDRYVEVLAEHQRVLRAAFEEHDGREVHTEGDAFFVAFGRASDAVAAAVSAQRALASHGWPEGVDVRVRMGLHTGVATLRLGDYVGLDVHRAARICSAGHGGQVLISSSTRELVANELPPDVALRDLGEHRLKDLDRPEYLFQIVADHLPLDFPPLGAGASSPEQSGGAGALPPPPNATIGREDDVGTIAELLCGGAVRLLTLTGPGGVGKTRLGLEAARAVRAQFDDGARFVSLAAVRRPDDVPSAIVQALAVIPVSGETPAQAAARFLSAKRVLLVLDNFEHVLSAAGFVSDMLTACSALTVLATSREGLDLQSEERYPVPPLAVPEPGGRDAPDELASVAAVALFCERARARDPGFALSAASAPAVAEICRRVDGLPLAIELAAARCGLLSPGEIAARLDGALGALGAGARDAPARQRTLRATIDWSHQLLSDAEKACFARLAVFAGGATVEAAETITGADLDMLDRLVAKSLLVRRPQAHARTRLLMLETIRAYATERLTAADDEQTIRERHYDYFLALAQRHGTDRALWGASGRKHLAQLDAENDNLHAALEWAVGQAGAEQALAMCAALGWYWPIRDRYLDAVEWSDRALSLPGADGHPALCVRALCIKAWTLWPLGRGAEQPAVMAEAEAIARALADPVILSQVLQTRAAHEGSAGRLDVARTLADEAGSCASAAGDDWAIAMAAFARALPAKSATELRERVDRAASLLDAVGNVHRLADLLASAAYQALSIGSDRDANDFLDRAVPIVHGLDNPLLRMLLRGNLALAALLTGETDAAREAFGDELRLSREFVVLPFASEGLGGLAAVATVHDDLHRAARLFGAAAAHRYGQPEDALDARLEATFFAPARARCGGDAWHDTAREGAALSFDDAIAYALDEPCA
jgi:predicted ATPase/class 3 adenylate cyclase